jgi:hypothetical protein
MCLDVLKCATYNKNLRTFLQTCSRLISPYNHRKKTLKEDEII